MIPTSAKSDFFGKDSPVFFVGQVESVDDPKRSGRVRVRCTRLASRSQKDEVKTEDLPWARVAMPTTHNQQGGVGGKHGLLRGAWVFGVFLDDEDAQKPLVLNTFNFTARSVDKDNREKTDEMPEKAFKKVDTNESGPNKRTTEANTEGATDHAKDTTLDDSKDGGVNVDIKPPQSSVDCTVQKNKGW